MAKADTISVATPAGADPNPSFGDEKLTKEDTIRIAFPNGGKLPASVIGGKTERVVPPHQGVNVPRRYGEHLIADRFAYEIK